MNLTKKKNSPIQSSFQNIVQDNFKLIWDFAKFITQPLFKYQNCLVKLILIFKIIKSRILILTPKHWFFLKKNKETSDVVIESW